MGEKDILVIRAGDAFSRSLRQSGFTVTNLELIETRPLADQSQFLGKLSRVQDYHGIFFTSPAAAEVFVKYAADASISSRLYAMGGRARDLIENAGFSVVHGNGANTAAEFVASFPEGEFAGKKLLFIRGDRSLLTIPTLLKDKADVEEVIVYETIEVTPDSDVVEQTITRLESNSFEWICFFSPSAIESFCRLFGSTQTAKVAVIGTTTAAAAEKQGVAPAFVSARTSAQEFSAGLIKYINGN